MACIVQQTSGYKINVTEAKEIKGGCIKCLLTGLCQQPEQEKTCLIQFLGLTSYITVVIVKNKINNQQTIAAIIRNEIYT